MSFCRLRKAAYKNYGILFLCKKKKKEKKVLTILCNSQNESSNWDERTTGRTKQMKQHPLLKTDITGIDGSIENI